MSTAARVGSINVVLTTKYAQGVAGLNKFAAHVEKTGTRTQQSVRGIDRSIGLMNRNVSNIGKNGAVFRSLSIGALRTRDSIGQMNGMMLAATALMGGLIPALSGTYLLKLSDRAKLAGNDLRTVTSSAAELKDIQNELFLVSQRTRSSFEGSVKIYSRMRRATEAFGTSQKDLLRITETINKAFSAGGASPEESKGAAIQLTQGIASDRFSGDEYRSVAENAPLLLKGIADSLGVNIGKLREMAHEGELTAKTVTEAILASSAEIDATFAKTVSTIGQAATKLDNAMLQFVSNSSNVSVASQGIVTIIDALAENLDTVADSLALVGIALVATFGGRKLAGVMAHIQAVSQLHAENKTMAQDDLNHAKASLAANKHANNTKSMHALYHLNQVKAARTEQIKNATAELASVKKLGAEKLATATAEKASVAQISAIKKENIAAELAAQRKIDKVYDKTNQTLLKSEKKLAAVQKAGNAALVADRNNLTGATQRLAVATNSATVSARAFAAAGSVARASWAFIGGPIGAALLAMGGAMYLVQQRTQAAEDRLSRYSFVLDEARNTTTGASKDLQQLAYDMTEVGDSISRAGLQSKLQQATEDIKNLRKEISERLLHLRYQVSGEGAAEAKAKLYELEMAMRNGSIGAEDLSKDLDLISKDHTYLSKGIDSVQNLESQLDVAAGAAEKFNDSLNGLDGKQVDVDINVNVNGHGLNAARISGLNEKMVENREALAEKHIENLKDLIKSGKKVDSVTRRMFSEELEDVKPNKKSKKSKRKSEAEKSIERFQKAINRLDYTKAQIGLSDVDKKAIDIARSAGVADDVIRQFISHIGGEGEEPQQLAQIKNRLEEISNIEFKRSLDSLSESNVLMFLSDVDRKTVETARSFGVAEEKVTAFIRAASTGELTNISTEMEQVRDRVSEIAQNENLKSFIDEFQSAFGGFISSAILGTDDLGDSFKNLIGRLAEMYIQMTLIDPLMKSLAGGAGGGGGFLGSLFGGFLGVPTNHQGGNAGVSNTSKVVSFAEASAAKKFHTGKVGVGHNEVMALLEKSESVYTADQNKRIASALGSNVGGSGMVKTSSHITVGFENDDLNLKPYVSRIANDAAQQAGSQTYQKVKSDFPAMQSNLKRTGVA